MVLKLFKSIQSPTKLTKYKLNNKDSLTNTPQHFELLQKYDKNISIHKGKLNIVQQKFKSLIQSTAKLTKFKFNNKDDLTSNPQHFDLLQKYDKNSSIRKGKLNIVQQIFKSLIQFTAKLTKFKLNNKAALTSNPQHIDLLQKYDKNISIRNSLTKIQNQEANDKSLKNENEFSNVVVQGTKFKNIENNQSQQHSNTENIIDDKLNKSKIIKINYSFTNDEFHQLVQKMINGISDEGSSKQYKSLNAVKEQHEKLVKYLNTVDIKNTIEKSKVNTALQIKKIAAKIKEIIDSPHIHQSVAKIISIEIIITILYVVSKDIFGFESELLEEDGISVPRKIISAYLYDFILQLPCSVLLAIIKYIMEQYFKNGERMKIIKSKTITRKRGYRRYN